ncbi:hypothetical protein J5N97_020118 [Dioscorea zingiberensis]|uniref:Uncharacterized protein n=1 Tax=Dioscorea zingiberensis TaxID=325984 RepID=A0A9D5CFT3_9LILI|nr:hypothetical protein J5N97_020118 [Dioscorea zingiberensis]
MELLKLEEAQLNAQKLEDELISWKSLLKEIPDVTCFNDILAKFAALQKEVIESMMKVGELSGRVKELEVSLEMAELSRQNAEKDCALAKDLSESSVLEAKRELTSLSDIHFLLGVPHLHGFYFMLEVVTVERDNLKMEMTAINKPRSGHEENRISNDRLVMDLESSLLARENAMRELENNLNDQREIINRQHNELQLLNDKLATEARRIKSLEREGERLRSEISLLESRYKAVFAEKVSVFRRACCSLFGYKIVMDDQQRPNGIPVTRFTLQSIYAQIDDEKLEFDYESGNASILVNEYTSQPEISHQVSHILLPYLCQLFSHARLLTNRAETSPTSTYIDQFDFILIPNPIQSTINATTLQENHHRVRLRSIRVTTESSSLPWRPPPRLGPLRLRDPASEKEHLSLARFRSARLSLPPELMTPPRSSYMVIKPHSTSRNWLGSFPGLSPSSPTAIRAAAVEAASSATQGRVSLSQDESAQFLEWVEECFSFDDKEDHVQI